MTAIIVVIKYVRIQITSFGEKKIKQTLFAICFVHSEPWNLGFNSFNSYIKFSIK